MYDKYIIDDKIYKVGLSIRLSREDGDDEESESITNQRSLLTKFVQSLGKNFQLIETYIDDGYSGLNFNRPGFKKMIKDIENNKINMVITKDLSRLGRDYIETGYYIEKYFPLHDVRYVAVNDGIDTFNEKSDGSDLMPFRLGMNDMYAKDISKKVRSHLITMKKDGLFASSTPPYGYIKDPKDKHKLIPDPSSANVVKKIFDLYIKGLSTQNIADYLTHEGILTPIQSKNMIGRIKKTEHPEIWKYSSIVNILKNRVYLGELIQHTSQNLSYKSKKRKKVPESEWIIVKNAHEALIDEETFEIAKRLRNRSNTYSKTRNKKKYNLSNLVYCKDCGAKMSISYEKKRDRTSMNCNSYRKFSKYNICYSHYINYDKLEKTVYERLKKFTQNLDIEEFVKILKKNLESSNFSLDKEISDVETKIEKLETRIDNLYIDKEDGVISQDRYLRLSNITNNEIINLKSRLDKLKYEKSENDNNKECIDYKKIVRNFLNLSNPTKEMINKLVKKIYVKSDKTIEIFYAFK